MSEFGSLNLEEMAEEETRLNSGGGGGGGNFLDQFIAMPQVKPGQKGSIAVRLLPPTKGTRLFQYNRTHKMNGRSVHCPKPLVNGKWDRNVACPICDYYSGLWKKIEKLEKQYGKDCPQSKPLKEEARSIKPKERYYYNAIARSLVVDGKEQKNVGPRILSVGQKLHKKIIDAIFGDGTDPESKLGNVTELKSGYDLIIRIEVTPGEEQFPSYDNSSFARSSSVAGTPDEIAKWASNVLDLTKLRNPRDMEYLEKELAIHRGLIADDAEGGFDEDAFDAKWGGGKKAAATTDQIKELMEHNPGAVSMNGVDVPAAKETEQPKVETQHIADDDFMKELEGMES